MKKSMTKETVVVARPYYLDSYNDLCKIYQAWVGNFRKTLDEELSRDLWTVFSGLNISTCRTSPFEDENVHIPYYVKDILKKYSEGIKIEYDKYVLYIELDEDDIVELIKLEDLILIMRDFLNIHSSRISHETMNIISERYLNKYILEGILKGRIYDEPVDTKFHSNLKMMTFDILQVKFIGVDNISNYLLDNMVQIGLLTYNSKDDYSLVEEEMNEIVDEIESSIYDEQLFMRVQREMGNHFVTSSCYSCGAELYKIISLASARKQFITGCPCCSKSFVE